MTGGKEGLKMGDEVDRAIKNSLWEFIIYKNVLKQHWPKLYIDKLIVNNVQNI